MKGLPLANMKTGHIMYLLLKPFISEDEDIAGRFIDQFPVEAQFKVVQGTSVNEHE